MCRLIIALAFATLASVHSGSAQPAPRQLGWGDVSRTDRHAATCASLMWLLQSADASLFVTGAARRVMAHMDMVKLFEARMRGRSHTLVGDEFQIQAARWKAG